jgi:predicted aspartyl protease
MFSLEVKAHENPKINVSLTFVNISIIDGINTVIVPFELVDGLMVIKAKINNDTEENFIIDTGANGLVLNKKYYSSISKPNTEGLGLNGPIEEIGNAAIDTTSIDELVFFDLNADVVDLSSIEQKKKLKINGLIGYNVLRNFELMLNYTKRYITLSRVDNSGNILDVMPHTEDKVDSFDLEIAKGVPVLSVKVNKIVKKMAIDTGSEFNLLNTKNNKDVMQNFTPSKRINISGAEGKNIDAVGGRLYRLSIGDRYKCGALSTVLMDLKNLSRLYGTNLDGILGFEFLSPWVMSVNYKKKLLYIHKIKFERP